MRVRWPNLFALVLLVSVVALLIRFPEEIRLFLAGMENIGPGYDPEEQTMGLIAFGMVALLIAAIVKVVVEGNRK